MKAEKSKYYFAGETSRDGTKGYWLELMAEAGVSQLTVYETKDHVIGGNFHVKLEATEEFIVLQLNKNQL